MLAPNLRMVVIEEYWGWTPSGSVYYIVLIVGPMNCLLLKTPKNDLRNQLSQGKQNELDGQFKHLRIWSTEQLNWDTFLTNANSLLKENWIDFLFIMKWFVHKHQISHTSNHVTLHATRIVSRFNRCRRHYIQPGSFVASINADEHLR
jgi:hypothetical protein